MCLWPLQTESIHSHLQGNHSKTWTENRDRGESVWGGNPNVGLSEFGFAFSIFYPWKTNKQKIQRIKKHQHDLKFIFCFHNTSSYSVFSLGLQKAAVIICSTTGVHREAVIIFTHLIIPYKHQDICTLKEIAHKIQLCNIWAEAARTKFWQYTWHIWF